MAHNIDLFTDHEMQIARALPNVMPDLATSLLAELIVITPLEFPSFRLVLRQALS